MNNYKNNLKQHVDRQARRMKKAEHEQTNIMAQTVYVGMLGLLFILPVVGGAYLGLWLDRHVTSFSGYWTTSLIVLGVLIGGVNVYLFIRE